jgi:hypothetical protein
MNATTYFPSAMKSSSHLLPMAVVVLALGLAAEPAFGQSRGYTGTQIFSTVGADKDEGEPNHCGEPGGASSWFFYRAPINGVLTLDTKGSSFDTVMAVYTGPGTDYASLVQVTCNNDASPTDTWSQVSFPATAGTMYYIAVDGVGAASGTVKLNYYLGVPPSITNAPQPQVVLRGGNVLFQVGAIGSAPLTFQWQYNGTDLPGATNGILNLTNVQLLQTGTYNAQARNPVGSAAAAAPLNVCSVAPKTNGLMSQKMTVNGQDCLRVIGNAASGSVLEVSTDLVRWQPVQTNQSPQGLFLCDDPATGLPKRFYRIRLAQ